MPAIHASITMPMFTMDSSLTKPRILCLHGGGTNARIFKSQCRVLEKRLAPHFRLVYAEAPFASEAGPDVLSVYKTFGPFKRWLRSNPSHSYLPHAIAIRTIDNVLEAAMDADDALGATGEFVGLMGFSQGAKIAASLLLRQQRRTDEALWPRQGVQWRFAVLLAGRGPWVNLDTSLPTPPTLSNASDISLSRGGHQVSYRETRHILTLPTIHMHGLQDPGLDMHREAYGHYCSRETSRLLEWDGNHRVPLKSKDVMPLVNQMVVMAEAAGVLHKAAAPAVLQTKAPVNVFWEELSMQDIARDEIMLVH